MIMLTKFASTVLVVVFWLFTMIGVTKADLYVVKTPAPNWCKYAKTYLVPTGSYPPINCSTPKSVPRCIKINNYGCLWQVSSALEYDGTAILNGRNGAHDGQGKKVDPPNSSGHAVFEHPKWSIAAKFIWFYRKSNGKSARQLARSYMKWCDIQGTHMSIGGWHRSCGLEMHQLTAGKNYCKEPEDGKPLPNQCKYCNCPDQQAAKWVRGTGLTIDDPLILFEEDGSPKPFMIKLALRNSVNELGGYKPNSKVVNQGLKIFRRWLKNQ